MLIAAYVSALNACGYCHGMHGATAAAFGVARDRLQALVDDLDSAPVDSG
jgi:AhpD family alkylhydroperoxidase